MKEDAEAGTGADADNVSWHTMCLRNDRNDQLAIKRHEILTVIILSTAYPSPPLLAITGTNRGESSIPSMVDKWHR